MGPFDVDTALEEMDEPVLAADEVEDSEAC